VESPRWYREQISQRVAEAEKANRKASELESKIADYERRGKDTTALTEQLKSKEEYVAKLEAQLAGIKYEKSPEYKDKFEKPFNDAAEYAKQVVEALQVVTEDGETQRPAKWEDFVEIYNLPPGKAEVLANRKFGNSASMVLRHFDKLRDLEHGRKQAVVEYETNASKRQVEERAKEVQQRDNVNKAWHATNTDLINANPELYGEKPDDEEGNAIWKESLALVDKAYLERDKLTDQERIILDAHIRLRAAALPRVQRELAVTRAENEELKARLGDKSASKPGKTQKPSDPAPKQPKSMLEEMRELNLINP